MIELIERFISRQEIAIKTFQKAQPWRFSSQKKPNKETVKKSVSGVNDQWRYLIHGKGCKVTNITTGETINWNISPQNSFDLYFFIEWLESIKISISKSETLEELKKLEKKGRLKIEKSNAIHLI